MRTRIYACPTDRVAFIATTTPEDARLLTIELPCPICQQPIPLVERYELAFKKVTLSGHELFRASQGLGLPNENDITIDNIRRKLSGDFVDVSLSDPSSDRVYIDSITTDYDVQRYKIHFGSAPRGAVIYKITKES